MTAPLDPRLAAELPRVRASDAVLVAAQEWDRATSGRPMSAAEAKLHEAVAAMVRVVKEGEKR